MIHQYEDIDMFRVSEDEACYLYKCELCGEEAETTHPMSNERLNNGARPCKGRKIVIREATDAKD